MLRLVACVRNGCLLCCDSAPARRASASLSGPRNLPWKVAHSAPLGGVRTRYTLVWTSGIRRRFAAHSALLGGMRSRYTLVWTSGSGSRRLAAHSAPLGGTRSAVTAAHALCQATHVDAYGGCNMGGWKTTNATPHNTGGRTERRAHGDVG